MHTAAPEMMGDDRDNEDDSHETHHPTACTYDGIGAAEHLPGNFNSQSRPPPPPPPLNLLVSA